MKKWLIRLIIMTLILSSSVMSSGEVSASKDNVNSFEEKAEKIDLNVNYDVNEVSQDNHKSVYNIDVKDEFGISNENFEMQVEEHSANEMNIHSQLITDDYTFHSNMYINVETGNMFVEVNENGKETKYDLIFKEIEGEDFKAFLVDKDTEKVYIMNTMDAHASILPVLAIVIQQGARWAVKKYGKKALVSAFGKIALNEAKKKLPNLVVKSKHLSDSTSTWAKFNTTSQATSKNWIKEALEKASISDFEINDDDKLSFKFDVNLGKKIGTKGETKIRIVIGYDGMIWTAFPVK